MQKRLYIVATPIGNLQDITIRAIRTLFSVDYIFAEQPDKTKNLLSEMEKQYANLIIEYRRPKVVFFNQFTENEDFYKLQEILNENNDIALVSEAGTPLISDPGYRITQYAIKQDRKIISIPGASAVISSLCVSGFPTDKFLFLGFLPKSQGKLENNLISLQKTLQFMQEKNLNPTVIFFESPHRLLKTLDVMQKVFGNIKLAIAREQTKKFEEVIRNDIKSLKEKYEKNPLKGEMTIIFSSTT